MANNTNAIYVTHPKTGFRPRFAKSQTALAHMKASLSVRSADYCDHNCDQLKADRPHENDGRKSEHCLRPDHIRRRLGFGSLGFDGCVAAGNSCSTAAGRRPPLRSAWPCICWYGKWPALLTITRQPTPACTFWDSAPKRWAAAFNLSRPWQPLKSKSGSASKSYICMY